MKFAKIVAIISIASLAAQAGADGLLRRDGSTATQADEAVSTTNTKEVIVINNQPAPAAAIAQPATNVEASPAVESKAEILRREREKAEVQTEQKIVEKLEDSRLQEERARADRLFGNKLDAPQQQQQQPVQAVVAPVPVAPPPAPVATPPAPVQPVQPTQVTIEKVEIVQPVQEQRIVETPVVAESKTEAAKPESEPTKQRYFVEGLAGNIAYGASNVKSNYAVGVGAGIILNDQFAIELTYMYSNHNIADVFPDNFYHTLDQNDIGASGKYYFITGKFKPYIGGSLTWVNRKYTDSYFYSNTNTTNTVDMGILGGLDFAVTDNFLIGAGLDYNFNLMTPTSVNWAAYGLPPGVQQLEKMSYTTMKVTAKFLF